MMALKSRLKLVCRCRLVIVATVLILTYNITKSQAKVSVWPQ